MNLLRLAKQNAKKIKTEKKLDDFETLQSKYIKLLEQKSDSFDLYIKYQEQCSELSKEKRILKAQLAESKETVTLLENQIKKLNRGQKRHTKNEKSIHE